VKQLQFSNKGRPTVREHTDFFFQGQPVYVGDLVEFMQNSQKEIGEVKKKRRILSKQTGSGSGGLSDSTGD
jgi:hypothetical protein